MPLGEDHEAYELDVMSGAAVVRTLSSDAPSLLYPVSDEVSDFGAPQAGLSVAIYQMSTTVGRGIPAAATMNL